MFGKFSEEAQKVLVIAKEEMSELKHPYVGSEHLLLAILKQNNSLVKKLRNYNLDYKKFKEELIKVVGVGSTKSDWFLYTPLLKRVIENSIVISKQTDEEVTVESLFLSLLEEGEGVAIRILIGLNLDLEKIYNDLSNSKKINHKKKSYLNEVATNLNKISNDFDPVIGRDEEIKRIVEILSRRTKNNPILIGEAGVGKTAIIEELVRLINKNEVPKNLKNKKIYSIDMASMVAGTKYRGEFEEKLKKVIEEVEENDDIILFVDEVHTIVGAGGAEGAIDASNIFKPSLARGKMRLIGATTIDEYKKYIEKDAALDRRFQKVFVEEPDCKKLKNILSNIKSLYESYHGVKISDEVIDKIIELSNKYIYDRFEPDKSLDILDEVCANVAVKELEEEKKLKKLEDKKEEISKEKNKSLAQKQYDKAYKYREKEQKINGEIDNLKLKLLKNNKKRNIKVDDVYKIINLKTKIPVYELNNNYKKQIDVLKKSFSKKIIGQNNAVDKLIEITKKIKLGLKESNKSYSLLFCGPTGVGKTYISKIFAENLVGKKNIIKLDMGEFSDSASINKLIGSPAGYIGYNDNKNIFEKIRSNPFSVLILDEVEKCNKAVLNLFLNILDEGKCTDSNGKEVRFDNVVIIMTSNAIKTKNLVGFNNINDNNLDEYFSKEFINRIDEIVEFNSFSEEEIEKIINNELKKYSCDCNISVEELKRESEYKIYGARKLKKIIKTKVESNILSNMS